MGKPFKRKTESSPVAAAPSMEGMVASLRVIIQSGRDQALRAVDIVQVRTCWEVGRHIVEFEQGGADRAQYGARLLPRLAEHLKASFGRGFDERNLRHMRAFFTAFPIWNALRSELSWTHYRLLLRVEDVQARAWYMAEAAQQHWSSRALERQMTESRAAPQEACEDGGHPEVASAKPPRKRAVSEKDAGKRRKERRP